MIGAACGVGCGTSTGATDPRCQTLCAVKQPALSGAYDVCSDASAAACAQDCTARIAGQKTVCQSCLLEKACFKPGGCGATSSDAGCNNGQCTITGRVGSCTYPAGDQAAADNCIRQVYPRRTVECAPTYRSVTECAALCPA